jgi:hypothetical protein
MVVRINVTAAKVTAINEVATTFVIAITIRGMTHLRTVLNSVI